MKKYWKIKDAKNSFEELISKALTEGPQIISKYSKPIAVVIPYQESPKQKKKKQKKPLGQFLLEHQKDLEGLAELIEPRR